MNKRASHKQSLPESADPDTWPNIIDPQSWPKIESNWPQPKCAQWLVNADPELEAIIEADRLALEQLLEAADRDLREALEADRLSFTANSGLTAT